MKDKPIDELVKKCLLTILDRAKDYYHEVEKTLILAIPIIQQAERERICKFLMLSIANLLDVKKIADGSYVQALKGES